jgi:hypothetical protein
MKAKLYLGDISQERIKPEKIGKVSVKEYFKKDDKAIVICCDAFCCILDCSRPVHPEDLVTYEERVRKWGPELVLRKEKFGGLVWNRRTGHIWELGQKETKICLELARGKSLNEVIKEQDVTESELFSLLADVTQQL